MSATRELINLGRDALRGSRWVLAVAIFVCIVSPGIELLTRDWWGLVDSLTFAGMYLLFFSALEGWKQSDARVEQLEAQAERDADTIEELHNDIFHTYQKENGL